MMLKAKLQLLFLLFCAFLGLLGLGWSQCAKKNQPIDPISGKWKVTALEDSFAKTNLFLITDPKGQYQELTPTIYNNLKMHKTAKGSYFRDLKIGSFVFIDKSGFYIDKSFAVMAPKLEGMQWQAFVKKDTLIYHGHSTRAIQIREMVIDQHLERFMPIGLKDTRPNNAVAIFLTNNNNQELSLEQEARFLIDLPSEGQMVIRGLSLKYKYQLKREKGEFQFVDSTFSENFKMYLQKEKL